jgi:type IV pilus assembly protein PilM
VSVFTKGYNYHYSMALGIDLGSSNLKVVRIKRTSQGFKLLGVSKYELASLEGSERELLLEALEEIYHAAPDPEVTIGIGGNRLNLQLFQLPALPPKQLQKALTYEVAERGGNDPNLYSDFAILKQASRLHPMHLVLLGLAQREAVDRIMELFREIKIPLTYIIPNGLALFYAYRYGMREGERTTTALVDLGAENMELVIVSNQKLIGARNISCGSKIFTEHIQRLLQLDPVQAEVEKVTKVNLTPSVTHAQEPSEQGLQAGARAGAAQLAHVMSSSINYLVTQLKEYQPKVERLLLSGGGARVKGLSGYLSSALKMPVEMLEPFREIDVSALDLQTSQKVFEHPNELTCSVGLSIFPAVSQRQPALVFLPEKIKRRRAFWQRKVFAWASVAILLVTFCFLVFNALRTRGSLLAMVQDRSLSIAKIKEKVQRIQKIERAQKDLNDKIQLLASISFRVRDLLDTISRLAQVTPGSEAWISRIKLQHEDKGDQKVIISILGYVHEQLKGGPEEWLKQVENRLQDPSRGIKARRVDVGESTEYPGWRYFCIHVWRQ